MNQLTIRFRTVSGYIRYHRVEQLVAKKLFGFLPYKTWVTIFYGTNYNDAMTVYTSLLPDTIRKDFS